MANPLKKTMVFLGLAEEELDEHGMPLETESFESAPAAQEKPTQRAQVTPLRKVQPVKPAPAHAMNEILTVHPTEYRDATAIAESFRAGMPVILNLSRMNEGEARRLIDFTSGLTMGLSGRIERVTNKVFLLTPEHIAVNSDERDSQHESGSFFVGAAASA